MKDFAPILLILIEAILYLVLATILIVFGVVKVVTRIAIYALDNYGCSDTGKASYEQVKALMSVT